ncbi:MAG: FG-GAP-like repeat-containing protein [candidate division WOR-3 bacterium]
MMIITLANSFFIVSLFVFPYQDGWPRLIEGGVDFSSPVLIDVNGDDTLEVLIAGNTHWIYLFNCHGENLPGWPKSTGSTPGITETSSPSVGDIDNDGEMEIVYASNSGELFAWEVDGNIIPGFPVSLGDNVIRACTMLEDIDGDGTLEICIGTGVSLYKFYVFRHNGSLLFSRNVEYRIHSTAAAADIDNDQEMEIIHGNDRNVQYGVYAWESNGDTCQGWPQPTGHHVDASPALADINGDSLYEVFVGSIDNRMYGWNYLGQALPSWPNIVGSGVYEGIISSPAIGDIDNDGILDIVTGRGIIQSTYGAVFAFRATGDTLAGFPVYINTGSITSSPALGDIDGDLGIEIIVGCQDGKLYAFNPDGSIVDSFPIPVAQSVTSSPALGDIDLDGDIEIVVGGKGATGTNDSLYIWDLPTQFNAQRVPWPMFHHDSQHTGRFPLQGYGVIETNARLIKTPYVFPTIIKGNFPFAAKSGSHLDLRIFNSAGIEIKHNRANLSNLPAGVYFVMYRSEDGKVRGMAKCIILK